MGITRHRDNTPRRMNTCTYLMDLLMPLCRARARVLVCQGAQASDFKQPRNFLACCALRCPRAGNGNCAGGCWNGRASPVILGGGGTAASMPTPDGRGNGDGQCCCLRETLATETPPLPKAYVCAARRHHSGRLWPPQRSGLDVRVAGANAAQTQVPLGRSCGSVRPTKGRPLSGRRHAVPGRHPGRW